MSAVLFYHVTRAPVFQTLSMLLDKSLERGWRVAVRGTEAARLDHLDQKLWLEPEDGFLPHGMTGGSFDADQPVLLTTAEGEAPNRPQCLISLDGAVIDPAEVAPLERVCILFDGQDPEAVQTARGQWRSLTGAGCAAQYWSEETGRWEKKADSA